MKIASILAIILCSFLLSACGFSLAGDVTPPPDYQTPMVEEQATQALAANLYPLVAPNPASGKAIYEQHCTSCHGPEGFGDGELAAKLPGPVAAIGKSEVARLATPADWFRIVTLGNVNNGMPPFSRLLNDRQRWDVLSYVHNLSAADSATQGAQLFQDNCAGCHGVSGKGDGPEAAAAGALADLTDQELMATKSAADLFQVINSGKGDMPAYAGQLSEAEIWALADTLRSLTFASSGEATNDQPANPAAEAAVPTPGKGSISGQVTNLTPQGKTPAGAEVTLHAFDQMQMAETLTTALQPDGTFAFSDVSMPEGRMFLATLDHQGVTYGSEVATIEPEQSTADLPVTIFDATSDLSALRVDRLHLFFENPGNNVLRVGELFIISNTGDKTVVAPGEGQPSILFNLPAGYTNLRFQDGELGGRFVETPNGFGDTASIYPGESNYQVLIAYDMPFNRKLSFAQDMTLPAEAVVVLAPESSLSVKGDNLEAAGERPVDGVPYKMYNAPSLKAGQPLNLTVSKVFSLKGRSAEIIGLAAFGLALILAGVYLYWRNRSPRSDADLESIDAAPIVEVNSADTGASLMDAILALDDQYQAGELPEEAYLARRTELKARLKTIMDAEKGSS